MQDQKMQDLKMRDLLETRRAFVVRYSEHWAGMKGSVHVRGIRRRTSNVLESYHAALRRRMSDKQRWENRLPIGRPRRKQQLKNDSRLQKCFEKYSALHPSRVA